MKAHRDGIAGGRPGLSLLEVLVALAIFLIAMGVLGHMINVATDRAVEVQQRGEAAQLCQSKLNEVMAGAIELVSQTDTPLDEDPNWLWSMEPESTEIPGLWRVNVRVSRERGNGERIKVAMAQMMLDPSIRGSAFDTPAAAVATPDTASSGTTDSGSSSGTGGTSSTPPSSGGSGGTGGTGTPTGGTGSTGGPSRMGGSGSSGTGSMSNPGGTGSMGTTPRTTPTTPSSNPPSGNSGTRGSKP